MPSHILHLEYLVKEYPDARLIWTHRDPITATGSLCSIISMSHQMLMGRIDTEWLGQDYPGRRSSTPSAGWISATNTARTASSTSTMRT
jgi:hypothetical protein